MHTFDQVAIRSLDLDADVQRFQSQGHLEWVRDTVEAHHIFVHPHLEKQLGDRFQVNLAFNYSLMPGIEFEIIELIKGETVQLMGMERLSHIGYHTARDQQPDGTIDSLFEELQRMQAFGCEILQISQTIMHSNTTRRYRYAFIRGGCAGDVPVKIIQRIIPVKLSRSEKSMQEGRELFAGLAQ